MAGLFTLKVFATNLLRENRRRYIFIFCFDVWPGRLQTHTIIKNVQALLLGICKKVKKTDRAASRANTQPCSEYVTVRTRIILILCYGESKSTSYVLLGMNMMSTIQFHFLGEINLLSYCKQHK